MKWTTQQLERQAMYANAKSRLSDAEIAELNQIVDENGIQALIRFAASKVSHEAADTEWGVNTRIALNKIALEVVEARSRFE